MEKEKNSLLNYILEYSYTFHKLNKTVNKISDMNRIEKGILSIKSGPISILKIIDKSMS